MAADVSDIFKCFWISRESECILTGMSEVRQSRFFRISIKHEMDEQEDTNEHDKTIETSTLSTPIFSLPPLLNYMVRARASHLDENKAKIWTGLEHP